MPSDKNSTGNAVAVQSSPVSLARAAVLSLASPGRARPDRSPFTSAINTATPGRAELLGDQLQRLGLAGSGRSGHQTVPVDGGQRDADLRRRVGHAVDDDRAQLQCLTVDGVACSRSAARASPAASVLIVLRPSSRCSRRAARQRSHYLPGGCRRRAHVGPSLSAVRDELVWIDCEMTGLDLGSDKLIEIAALVTDADLNILGDGVDVVIHADDAALSSMIDVVTEMHTRSGLIDEVRASTVDLATAEAMVLDYVGKHVKQPKTAPLAGNSIATDRSFIARDMPALDSFLHYRMIDVSSIKELCRRWYPRIYFGQPTKGLSHRALADIHESIRELQFYRRTAFVPPPGPSTSEIDAVVAELADGARRTGTKRFGRRATDRLVSTSPLVSPALGSGPRPW